MAQLERPQRYVDGTKNPATIQTMEQLIRGNPSSPLTLTNIRVYVPRRKLGPNGRHCRSW